MSAPVVSYGVWQNALLAASRFDALVKRVHALCAELSEVAELWQKARDQYGEEYPAWSYGDTEVPAFVRKLATIMAKMQIYRAYDPAKGRYEDVIDATSAEVAFIASRNIHNDAGKLEAVVRKLAKRVAKAKGEYARQETLAKENSRLLETLAAEVSPQDRTAIEQQAQEAVRAPQASRRQALLMQLRLDIQRANKAGRARQRKIQQAEQWRERLLGFAGPEVEQLDVALRRIADGDEPLPPDMAQKVEGVVARATEASNRAYALGVITDELENLGYVAEVGFETASAQAPEMLLHKPDMEDDYHVSLRVETGALHNQVVREASDASDRSAERERTDEQMERTWCQDFATALAAAERRGVRGRAVERLEPGAVPVQTIAPLKGKSKPKSKRKRRRTDQLKSRAGR